MRLHIQNPPEEQAFSITMAQWQSAIDRNPEMTGLKVTIGADDDAIERALPDTEVLLSWVSVVADRFRRPVPPHAPRLRIISCTSAGVDRLAPFEWLPPGVALLNNRGTHAEKAGEFGMMALLMLQSRMPALIQAQQAQAWTPLLGTTLRGRVLCVVGMGSLGSAVARRARAFGMHVVGVRNADEPHPDCDETVSADRLDEVLTRTDDLLLSCPLTDRTRNLLSRERIALLRSHARIVNIARGQVWDQDAVCDALDAERLDAVFTDVAVPEPLPPSHRLWRTRNMIVTPHISADDRLFYNDRTLDILFANLRADAEGRPLPNQVDPRRGY